jgi:integrase
LAEWLELTPKTEREGPIIPGRWRDKIKAVRKASKVTGQDVCRHSFASYALASHNDLKQLQSDMGHNTPNMILDHYKAAVDRSEAVEFWSIRPDGKGVKLKSA